MARPTASNREAAVAQAYLSVWCSECPAFSSVCHFCLGLWRFFLVSSVEFSVFELTVYVGMFQVLTKGKQRSHYFIILYPDASTLQG